MAEFVDLQILLTLFRVHVVSYGGSFPTVGSRSLSDVSHIEATEPKAWEVKHATSSCANCTVARPLWGGRGLMDPRGSVVRGIPTALKEISFIIPVMLRVFHSNGSHMGGGVDVGDRQRE